MRKFDSARTQQFRTFRSCSHKKKLLFFHLISLHIWSIDNLNCFAWETGGAIPSANVLLNQICGKRKLGVLLSAHFTWTQKVLTSASTVAVKVHYRWLGHIPRMPNNRLIKEAVKVQFYSKSPDNMFMDVPKQMSFDELVSLAADRKNGEKTNRVYHRDSRREILNFSTKTTQRTAANIATLKSWYHRQRKM